MLQMKGISLDFIGGRRKKPSTGVSFFLFFFCILETGKVKLTERDWPHSRQEDDIQMMFNIPIDGGSFSKNLEDFDSIRSVLLYRSVKPLRCAWLAGLPE